MEFDSEGDRARADGRFGLLLLVLLLTVPIFGGFGVLVMAVASAWMP